MTRPTQHWAALFKLFSSIARELLWIPPKNLLKNFFSKPPTVAGLRGTVWSATCKDRLRRYALPNLVKNNVMSNKNRPLFNKKRWSLLYLAYISDFFLSFLCCENRKLLLHPNFESKMVNFKFEIRAQYIIEALSSVRLRRIFQYVSLITLKLSCECRFRKWNICVGDKTEISTWTWLWSIW